MDASIRTHDDNTLLALMREDNDVAFQELYQRHRKAIFRYVYNRLQSEAQSEEIVQEVFFTLWAQRHTLTITHHLIGYLYGVAKNNVLHQLRRDRVRKDYASDFTLFMLNARDNSNAEYQNLQEINTIIQQSLTEMPEKWQTAFRLSREQHLPIQDIAEQMGISVKTAHNYLSLALGKLRLSLGEFMVLVVLASI